jgi:ubiquinone/menaquinone biosynthesis C-methylase UbiE
MFTSKINRFRVQNKRFHSSFQINPENPFFKKNFWDKIEKNYDLSLFGYFTRKFAPELIARVANPAIPLFPELKNYKFNILDVGAGHGAVVFELVHQNPGCIKALHAIDISDTMVGTLKQKVLQEKRYAPKTNPPFNWDCIDLSVMNAEELTFNDNEYDVVISNFTIMFIPNRKKALSEIHRVMKPRGIYVSSFWGYIEENPAIQFFYNSVNRLKGGKFGDDYNINFILADQNNFKSELKHAGFRDVRIVKEKIHFNGTEDELVQLALNSSLIDSSMKEDFKKILEEEAKILLRDNKAYTTANICEARK